MNFGLKILHFLNFQFSKLPHPDLKIAPMLLHFVQPLF